MVHRKLSDDERVALRAAVSMCGTGELTQAEAARLAGVDVHTISRRLQAYGAAFSWQDRHERRIERCFNARVRAFKKAREKRYAGLGSDE